MNFSTKKKIGLSVAAAALAASGYLAFHQQQKVSPSTNPWVIILPNDCTKNVTDSAGLTSALSGAQPGDVICAAAGNYSGLFTLNTAGSQTNPITVKAVGHASVAGGFKINAEQNYLLNFDITGGSVPGVDMFCKNCGVINNVIHGQIGNIGIGAWNTGPGQIIYGNIIYTMVSTGQNPHNIYTQNNYTTNGYKYFVENISVDPAATGNTFIFHAYTEGGFISGMWVERNVFANGAFLIGGFNEPHHHEMVKGNYYYKSDGRFGYRRPTQFHFDGNYVGRAGMWTDWLWGSPEGCYQNLLTEPSTITGNTFAFSTRHIGLRTSAYSVCGTRDDCKPVFRQGDISNNNTFIAADGKFHGSLCVNNTNYAAIDDLSNWRNYTETSGGIRFDVDSVQRATETNKIFFDLNEYDSNRGKLVIYNWEGLAAVPVTLPKPAEIRDIKDFYGPPVVTCTSYPCDVPAGEFSVFAVVLKETPPPSTCGCDINAADAELVKALGYIDQNRKRKAKGAITNARNIIAPCKN